MDISTLSPEEALVRLLRWMGINDTKHLVVPEHWRNLLPSDKPPADVPKGREELFTLLQQINNNYPEIKTADIQFASALFKQAKPDFSG